MYPIFILRIKSHSHYPQIMLRLLQILDYISVGSWVLVANLSLSPCILNVDNIFRCVIFIKELLCNDANSTGLCSAISF